MNNLKRLRMIAGLSQKQLAEKTQIKQPNISRFENGERALINATGDVLLRLAKALECSVEELLKEDEKMIKFELCKETFEIKTTKSMTVREISDKYWQKTYFESERKKFDTLEEAQKAFEDEKKHCKTKRLSNDLYRVDFIWVEDNEYCENDGELELEECGDIYDEFAKEIIIREE